MIIDWLLGSKNFSEPMEMCCKYCMMHGFKFSDPSVD